jgi:hypothetical protein
MIALFLFPVSIFIRLYQVHNYYQCANAIFLITSLGILIVGALENPEKSLHNKAVVIYISIIMIFIGNALWYFHFKNTYSNKYAEIADYIEYNTYKDDVILITGSDYSSEIPYYSKRKAIMFPEYVEDYKIDEILTKVREEKIKISAIITCNNPKKYTVVNKYFDSKSIPDFYSEGCKVDLLPKFKEI